MSDNSDLYLIDTHTHLYDEAFDSDLELVISNAKQAGVGKIFMPAIDSSSHSRMIGFCEKFEGFAYPMMGLHPTSVNDNPHYTKELELVERYLKGEEKYLGKFYAIGEIGLDLYWSKDYLNEQIQVLNRQIELALEYNLPVVIHTRDAWPQMREVIKQYGNSGLKGIMHSFSGSIDDYHQINEYGDFYYGVGGVVTYKKSPIAGILPSMALEKLVLETDSPYLTPVPFRGKRNESAYLKYICDKVADLLVTSADKVAEVTSDNALKIFGIDK